MPKNKRISFAVPKERRLPRTVLLALLLLLLLSVSTVVLAYYIWQSEPVDNQFELMQVSCQANEVFDGTDKTSVTVKNNASVPVYIRVRLVSYWQTPSGNIAGRTSVTPSLDEVLGPGWLADTDNNTYYCVAAVNVGASTPDLIKIGSSIHLETDADGYIQVVEILAEAIQAEPAAAVEEAWGVTLDENGNILNP